MNRNSRNPFNGKDQKYGKLKSEISEIVHYCPSLSHYQHNYMKHRSMSLKEQEKSLTGQILQIVHLENLRKFTKNHEKYKFNKGKNESIILLIHLTFISTCLQYAMTTLTIGNGYTYITHFNSFFSSLCSLSFCQHQIHLFVRPYEVSYYGD